MSEPYLGEIRMFGGNFPPIGWEFCNGQLLPISGNEALCQLIGTTYGGDGQNTFALPELRGRLPLHVGTNPSTGTTFTIGQSSGVETVTLTTSQLPAHSHPVQANSTNGDSTDPNNNVWGLNNTLKSYVNSAPNGTMSTSAIISTGGSQPHDNMMPYLAVSFIIATQGIYPSRVNLHSI
jgi:microcystin-dependent protein